VAGVEIERVEDLQRVMTREMIGRRVDLMALRGGRELTVAVTPAELDTQTLG
jgi:S1-C subfamily serine protease